MMCCCSLAGTSACDNCYRKVEFENKKTILYDVPFTYIQTDKRLIEIETAIKRLNERIDEILGEENG